MIYLGLSSEGNLLEVGLRLDNLQKKINPVITLASQNHPPNGAGGRCLSLPKAAVDIPTSYNVSKLARSVQLGGDMPTSIHASQL